ncbi:MAG TPA: hypothetical protein PLJ84_10745 [Bacteroidales bacterium]|nr:hypothetical protein [Bacteroidales bacterium]HPT03064.1 hypothetical protein [Bacteroidales bacterium]
MNYTRKDHELPLATSEWGWKFHHIGIPVNEPFPGEEHIAHLGIYAGGFKNSPYGIEFMRFEPHCKVHELVKKIPHVAFVVDDMETALIDKELLGEVNSPSPGLKVAMILHNGAPVELMEFSSDREAG